MADGDLEDGTGPAACGTGRRCDSGFLDSRSSHSLAQDFWWISMLVVPNSRPLNGTYHMWHIRVFGMILVSGDGD